jgi:DNA-3-methyladenine glycosylase
MIMASGDDAAVMDRKLGREFFARPALQVARDIIGKGLVRTSDQGTVSGTIIEAEAYAGVADPGSHTYGGRRTPRNEVLWGPPCHAYVYPIYGIYQCFNIVCSGEGDPQGVFVRAVRPDRGLELMASRRGIDLDERSRRQLCNGPSKLCIAFAIGRDLNGTDACGAVLYLTEGEPPGKVVAAPRVGIDYAGEAAAWPWRFLVEGDPGISRRSWATSPVPRPPGRGGRR